MGIRKKNWRISSDLLIYKRTEHVQRTPRNTETYLHSVEEFSQEEIPKSEPGTSWSVANAVKQSGKIKIYFTLFILNLYYLYEFISHWGSYSISLIGTLIQIEDLTSFRIVKFIYLFIYVLTYLLSYLLTYLLTYLLSYLLTYLLT